MDPKQIKIDNLLRLSQLNMTMASLYPEREYPHRHSQFVEEAFTHLQEATALIAAEMAIPEPVKEEVSTTVVVPSGEDPIRARLLSMSLMEFQERCIFDHHIRITDYLLEKFSNVGIVYLRSLLEMSPRDVKRIPGMGSMKYHDLVGILKQYNLSIGMYIPVLRIAPDKVKWLAIDIDKFPDWYNSRTAGCDLMPLEVRALNCLHAENIYTIRDLIQSSEERLLAIPNFGKAMLQSVYNFLNYVGLFLNTKVD